MRTVILFLAIVLLIAAPLPACEATPLQVAHAVDGGHGLGCPGCPGCPDNPVRDPNAPACF